MRIRAHDTINAQDLRYKKVKSWCKEMKLLYKIMRGKHKIMIEI